MRCKGLLLDLYVVAVGILQRALRHRIGSARIAPLHLQGPALVLKARPVRAMTAFAPLGSAAVGALLAWQSDRAGGRSRVVRDVGRGQLPVALCLAHRCSRFAANFGVRNVDWLVCVRRARPARARRCGCRLRQIRFRFQREHAAGERSGARTLPAVHHPRPASVSRILSCLDSITRLPSCCRASLRLRLLLPATVHSAPIATPQCGHRGPRLRTLADRYCKIYIGGLQESDGPETG